MYNRQVSIDFMDFAPCLWIWTASAWHNLWRNLARKILQNGRSSIDSEGQFFSMQCNSSLFPTFLSVCQIDSVEWKTMRKKHVVTSFLLDPVFQRSHICTFPPPKTTLFWDLSLSKQKFFSLSFNSIDLW